MWNTHTLNLVFVYLIKPVLLPLTFSLGWSYFLTWGANDMFKRFYSINQAIDKHNGSCHSFNKSCQLSTAVRAKFLDMLQRPLTSRFICL